MLRKPKVNRAPTLGLYCLESITDSLKTKFGYSSDNPDAPQEEAYLWHFVSADGVVFDRVTGISYGFPKAALTQMVNGIEGKMLTEAEFEAIDLEAYQGQWFQISTQLTEANDGELYTKLLGIKKASPPAKPAK